MGMLALGCRKATARNGLQALSSPARRSQRMYGNVVVRRWTPLQNQHIAVRRFQKHNHVSVAALRKPGARQEAWIVSDAKALTSPKEAAKAGSTSKAPTQGWLTSSRAHKERPAIPKAQLVNEVSSADVSNEQSPDSELGLPWTASIVAAAASAVASVEMGVAKRRGSMSSTMFSAPGEDFLSLCQSQLGLASKVLGQDTTFTVYIRTPESYASGQVDLQPVAIFPNLDEPDYLDIIRLVAPTEEQLPERQVEHWLVREEAIEVSQKRALVLPMSRGSFLVGMLVAERSASFAEATDSEVAEIGNAPDDVNGTADANMPDGSVGSSSDPSSSLGHDKRKEVEGYASAGRIKGRTGGKRGKAKKAKKGDSSSPPPGVIESPRQIRQRLQSLGKGFRFGGKVKEIIDVPSQEVSVSEDGEFEESSSSQEEGEQSGNRLEAWQGDTTVGADLNEGSGENKGSRENASTTVDGVGEEERSSSGSQASTSGRIFDWSKLDVSKVRAMRDPVKEEVKVTRAQAIGKQLQELFAKGGKSGASNNVAETDEEWPQELFAPPTESASFWDEVTTGSESSKKPALSARGEETVEETAGAKSGEESTGENGTGVFGNGTSGISYSEEEKLEAYSKGGDIVGEVQGGVYSATERAIVVEVAKTVAVAAVMDQRTLFLQQASWQRGVRLDGMLEQVRGPLAALRTLGKSLMPITKQGEVSRDVAENIVVQGERMKDVIVQIQDELYPSQGAGNLVHYDRQALPATAGPKTAALLEPLREGVNDAGLSEGEQPVESVTGANGIGATRGSSAAEFEARPESMRKDVEGASAARGFGGGVGSIEGNTSPGRRTAVEASSEEPLVAESISDRAALSGNEALQESGGSRGATEGSSDDPSDPREADARVSDQGTALPAPGSPVEASRELATANGGSDTQAEAIDPGRGGASAPSLTPRNISELTESLLAIETDAQMVDVADVLSQLVRACTPIAEYKELSLEHVSPPPGGLPLIAAEPHAIRQVLSIVLDNALRYTQRGGWVRCELVDGSGAGVFMRVEDDGPGMNLLLQAQAFVPTSPDAQLAQGENRLPAQLESQRQSSGLSIARDLVEQVGGVMRIRSPRVADAPAGHWGTHVEIWLPSGVEQRGTTDGGGAVPAQHGSDQVLA